MASIWRGVISISLPPKSMPCGSRGHRASVKPSGPARTRCANACVLDFVTLVRIADSRCDVPVLYSISVPGALTSGRLNAYRTQFRLRTHVP
jgi:hypothetical protein